MKIIIELDTATSHRIDFVKAANSLLAAASLYPLAQGRMYEVELSCPPKDGEVEQPVASAEPAEQKPARTRRTKAEMEAAAAPAPEQQTELPVEEPAPAPAETNPAPAATPAAAVPDFAAVKAAAVDLVNKHGGEIQSALTKFISVQFKDADGNPARLFTLTDDGRAKTMATVQACAALADKDAILKHLAV